MNREDPPPSPRWKLCASGGQQQDRPGRGKASDPPEPQYLVIFDVVGPASQQNDGNAIDQAGGDGCHDRRAKRRVDLAFERRSPAISCGPANQGDTGENLHRWQGRATQRVEQDNDDRMRSGNRSNHADLTNGHRMKNSRRASDSVTL